MMETSGMTTIPGPKVLKTSATFSVSLEKLVIDGSLKLGIPDSTCPVKANGTCRLRPIMYEYVAVINTNIAFLDVLKSQRSLLRFFIRVLMSLNT